MLTENHIRASRCERSDSGATSDVQLHRVQGKLQRRSSLLRQAGVELLHSNQDCDFNVEARTSKIEKLSYHAGSELRTYLQANVVRSTIFFIPVRILSLPNGNTTSRD